MVMRDKLSMPEAAAILGISPLTLKDWAREGRIASFKIGRRVLFAKAELEAFLNTTRRPARSTLPVGTGAA
jgi:excisionase family DNA binding protein